MFSIEFSLNSFCSKIFSIIIFTTVKLTPLIEYNANKWFENSVRTFLGITQGLLAIVAKILCWVNFVMEMNEWMNEYQQRMKGMRRTEWISSSWKVNWVLLDVIHKIICDSWHFLKWLPICDFKWKARYNFGQSPDIPALLNRIFRVESPQCVVVFK